MVNSYTKVLILSVFAVAVALTACKKDDEATTAASFTLETMSLDFEWGQTKELPFTTYRIVTVNVPTDLPDGWSCTLEVDRFVITAPASSSAGDDAGAIKFTATTDAGTTLTRDVGIAVLVAEEITDAANSFIISKPATRYKFNATRRGNEATGTITGGDSAILLWTTSTQAVSNVTLEDNGYIYFRTGGTDKVEEGNAVVALLDDEDKVLWSWHIWVTDYDPSADPDILGGMEVMNRNLGAFTNSNATPEDVVRSYGLYYQWGRKDPFVGPVAWNSTAPPTLYGHADNFYYDYAVSDVDDDEDDEFDYPGTVEYAVAHPGTFIAGSEDDGFDWLAASNDGLWGWGGSDVPKTIYDPCPAGWRVAPRDIWFGFRFGDYPTSDPTEYNVVGEYNHGWTFSVDDQEIYLPAAGRRSFSPSLANNSDNFTNVVNGSYGEEGFPVGFYWSSKSPLIGSLAFRHDYINVAGESQALDISETAPAGGFPLRCVAE